MALWASALALAAAPISVQAAESATASGWLTLEPSVGASLSVGLSDGLMLQIGLPGARRAIRPGPDMPLLVMAHESTELVADSAVSLRVERRSGSALPPGMAGDKMAGGGLLILAQFN
jgi:hypothetical protein